MKIKDYEIIRHGVEWPDYFQGCGVSFTTYDHVQTGIGSTEEEAFDDALDSLSQSHDWGETWPEGDIGLPDGEEWNTQDAHEIMGTVPEECDESPWWHVSIRYNLA